MEHRVRQFADNVAANIVSWVIIGIISAVGAGMIALFAIVTHGLSPWGQAGILGISAFVIAGLGLMGYVAFRTMKLTAQNVPASELPGEPTAPLGLRVIKASWGNAHASEPVADIITSMQPNAIAFRVDPDTLKNDPALVPESTLRSHIPFPGARPKRSVAMKDSGSCYRKIRG